MKNVVINRRHLLMKMTIGSCATLVGAAFSWPRLACAENATRWSYQGSHGPAHWGDLSAQFAVCKRGQRQSPVDLAGAGITSVPEFVFSWQSFDAYIQKDEYRLQITASGETGNVLALGEKTYIFQHCQFHHPSEHTFRNRRWPLEAQMLYKGQAADFVMISVLFRPGRENGVLDRILAHIPTNEEKSTIVPAMSIKPLFPESAANYRYSGSFTAPPCSETVSWVVFRDPVEASIGQLNNLARMFPMNARPLQRSFQRDIVLDIF